MQPALRAALSEHTGTGPALTWAGHPVPLRPGMTALELLELMDTERESTALLRFIQATVTPDGWPGLRRVLIADKTDQDGLVDLGSDIALQVLGRPTRPSLASRCGSLSTSRPSTATSCSTATPQGCAA